MDKPETRNPKFESNPKPESRNMDNHGFRTFENSNLIRPEPGRLRAVPGDYATKASAPSNFGFRIFSGFTLTELLVVIGIIAILVGILFPIIGRVRRAAYVADTQNEISQIANACNQYYSTFNAYPGPLSNDQIETSSGTPTPDLHYYYNTTTNPPTYSTLPGKYYITGSENLTLGLMGGLRLNTATTSTINGQLLPYTLVFAPTEVGLGPLSLNPLNPARTPSFFPSGSNYLMWTETNPTTGAIGQTTQYNPAGNLSPFADQAGTMAADSPIPDFVDRFPTPGPMPILYLRARTGAKGTLSFVNASTYGLTPPTDPTTNQNAEYQYDVGDIYAYTSTSIGLTSTNSHDLNNIGTVPTTTWPPANVAKAGVTNATDGFSFFVNSSITPTTMGPNYVNYSSRPRAVDQFILISAGPDGIYGTADDITSFGNVSQ
jgi:prepilin-type N-terminal cleavage/methylation domain-containing protein